MGLASHQIDVRPACRLDSHLRLGIGIGIAVLLVRGRFWGKRLLSAAIDLPIAVSPVIVCLALILVYGIHAPAGGWLGRHGVLCLAGAG